MQLLQLQICPFLAILDDVRHVTGGQWIVSVFIIS